MRHGDHFEVCMLGYPRSPPPPPLQVKIQTGRPPWPCIFCTAALFCRKTILSVLAVHQLYPCLPIFPSLTAPMSRGVIGLLWAPRSTIGHHQKYPSLCVLCHEPGMNQAPVRSWLVTALLPPPWRAPPGARGAAPALVEYVGTL